MQNRRLNIYTIIMESRAAARVQEDHCLRVLRSRELHKMWLRKFSPFFLNFLSVFPFLCAEILFKQKNFVVIFLYEIFC